MKVACLGNMNNNLFTLTRFLRDRGTESDLLLFNNEFEHFHPGADSFDEDYRRYTRQLSWGSTDSFLATPRSTVIRDLKTYDFIVGCGTAPAFLSRAGLNLDVFAPYGSDLYQLPFLRPRLLGNPLYNLTVYFLAKAQSSGIRGARYLHRVSPASRKSFARIGAGGECLESMTPMVYTPLYNPDSMAGWRSRSRWYRQFLDLRARHDLLVFHHSRHVWKSSDHNLDYKGNDILVHGFAEFAANCQAKSPCLILFRYGPDVPATESLVERLGISSRVKWFPRMPRKDIMAGLSLADIGTGEFSMGWFWGGVIFETLAMAKPLLHYRKDSLYSEYDGDSYPLLNVGSAEDIAAALADFEERPSHYRSLGESGRRWLQESVVDRCLDDYMRILPAGPGENASANSGNRP